MMKRWVRGVPGLGLLLAAAWLGPLPANAEEGAVSSVLWGHANVGDRWSGREDGGGATVLALGSAGELGRGFARQQRRNRVSAAVGVDLNHAAAPRGIGAKILREVLIQHHRLPPSITQ